MTLEEKKKICIEIAKKQLKESTTEEEKKAIKEYLKLWGEKE